MYVYFATKQKIDKQKLGQFWQKFRFFPAKLVSASRKLSMRVLNVKIKCEPNEDGTNPKIQMFSSFFQTTQSGKSYKLVKSLMTCVVIHRLIAFNTTIKHSNSQLHSLSSAKKLDLDLQRPNNFVSQIFHCKQIFAVISFSIFVGNKLLPFQSF